MGGKGSFYGEYWYMVCRVGLVLWKYFLGGDSDLFLAY